MKTYEITQVSEMMATFKVRAKDAEEANRIATERMEALCNRIQASRKNVNFGDITDDYLPARDE